MGREGGQGDENGAESEAGEGLQPPPAVLDDLLPHLEVGHPVVQPDGIVQGVLQVFALLENVTARRSPCQILTVLSESLLTCYFIPTAMNRPSQFYYGSKER